MDASAAVAAFSAIAQETRLSTLKMLVQAGPRGRAAGAIAAELNLAAPTLSFHLKEMERAGLIHARKEGRSIIYAADYGGLRDLIDYLLADCCGGDKRLCGPYIIKESC